jgi:histidinol-phosphate aminotransferase
MYRVVTEQRPAGVVAVPRRGPEAGWAIDVPAVRAAAAGADVVWLCSPNNPTALAEPAGAIEALLEGIAADAAVAGRPSAIVVVDEAYAEFTGETLLPLRLTYRNLVVIRTASKAYALAGLRVGFAIARPELIAEIAPYRPPGSVSTISVTVVTEALLEPTAMRANVARVRGERDRFAAELASIGWPAGPSATNFLLVEFGSPARAEAAAAGLLRNGIVPRTFGDGHPLASCLRLTIRTADENDRLIAAARAGSER